MERHYISMIFFSAALYLTFVLAVVASDEPKCVAPKKIADFDWNVTSVADGFYFPIGQKNDTNLIKVMLYGSSLNPDEDLPKLCPRIKFNDTNAVISGVNGTSAHFICEKVGGKKWIVDCKYNGDNTEYNHKIFVTLTDNKTFAFAVRCWGNGLKSWTVFSPKKFLHDDVQFHILEHAKSLNFETAEALPLRYKSCS